MSAQPTPVSAHASLAEALAAFQAEAPTFPKTKTARVQTKTGGEYTYKYAGLGEILPTVGPLLAKHGLSWSSKPGRGDDGELVLRYTLRHSSVQEDMGEMPLGVERGCKPQELGSAITYARRYAMTAQLNLATDEDDDGQTAQAAGRARNAQPPQDNGNGNGTGELSVIATATPAAPAAVAVAAKPSNRPASAGQRAGLRDAAAKAGLSPSEFADMMKTALGVEPLPWTDEDAASRWLKRNLDRLPARLVDAVLVAIETS